MIKEEAFYQNGYMRYEGEFDKDGKRHGEWTYWYENGNVWSEGYFSHGKSDGIRKGYHVNGQKYFKGEYDKGQQTGIWTFWDENGTLVKEENFSN